MKKLIMVLFVLLVFGGAAFYFGMVSFRVPSDSVGIVFTKTRGWHPDLVIPGRFTWLPDALLPTNLTLYSVQDSRYDREIICKGTLPNAETYLDYLEQKADFSWNIRISLKARIDSSSLANLFSSHGLRPETIDGLISDTITGLGLQIQALLQDMINSGNIPGTTVMVDMLVEKLKEAAASSSPWLSLSDIVIAGFSMPDLELYNAARSHYLAILQNQTDKLLADVKLTAEINSTQTIKMDILRRYGELFTQYPVILQFLSIDSENAKKLLPESWE